MAWLILPWGLAWMLAGIRWGPWIVGWLNEKGMDPGDRPYTQAEIERADCFRCGSPASHQWQVCADHNIWRPLCFSCDVQLNRQTLEWMGHPQAHALMLDYISTREV
jgi:hypothetical protein